MLFHGTSTTRLDKILEEGIVPKMEKCSTIHKWDGTLTKAVCLTASKKEATAWANRKVINEGEGNPVIITINIPKKKLFEGKENNCNKKLSEFISFDKVGTSCIVEIMAVKKLNGQKVAKILGLKEKWMVQ